MWPEDIQSADIWLFPGLNGSGRFHQPFCEQLLPQWRCMAVALPNEGPQDYDTLVRFFSPLFEARTRPVVLIGESFSGPLVYELACRFPHKVSAIIWAASFVDNPRPWLSKLPLPTGAIHVGRYLPARAIYQFAFQRNDDLFWPVFLQERKTFKASIWRQRIQAATRHRHPRQQLTIPCLYLQASKDLLIRPFALCAIKKVAPQVKIEPVLASHLLLQSNPNDAAKKVTNWLNNELA